ncbi:MATE efflux family protein 1 [Gossypium arboreum]|uniref:MATE efflux family protein 1 n=1 Tax=Gossypium arboreum TaxID=29729 RepID=A0A0B0PF32_GOSAR|nr:MATE efflux family protein 1 [Gossypium arboreum]
MFPLVSITTSFVAEEEATSKPTTEAEQDANPERESDVNQELVPLTGNGNVKKSQPDGNSKKHVPSASSALESPMLNIAQQYLTLRSLGAPAILLSLAAQGVFRGLKDTKTPLYAIRFQLLIKVISTTSCVTVAASLAARQGSNSMAAFQVCLQIWLATSLLADGLAVAGQAILASSFAKKDYEKIVATASRVLQIGVLLGFLLSCTLAALSQFAAQLFTNDRDVMQLMNLSFPFIAVTQPINTLAFVFDGVNYGASDFAYSAYSMVLVAVVSIFCLFILSSSSGYIGIWIALTIFMNLRVFAGLLRVGTGTGPWSFLRN